MIYYSTDYHEGWVYIQDPSWRKVIPTPKVNALESICKSYSLDICTLPRPEGFISDISGDYSSHDVIIFSIPSTVSKENCKPNYFRVKVIKKIPLHTVLTASREELEEIVVSVIVGEM